MNMNTLTLNKTNITDFAKERNELLKKSKSEWNLFLDNDETITNPINQLFSKTINDAYYIYRKNYFLGKYVGTDKIIRLVKKGTGKWMRGVHEVWVPNDLLRVGVINDSFITHNTASNLALYLEKVNYYSTLHAKANFNEGKRSSIFKIIFYPIAKFIFTFVKSRHVVFSIMQSLHSFISWSKLYLRQY